MHCFAQWHFRSFSTSLQSGSQIFQASHFLWPQWFSIFRSYTPWTEHHSFQQCCKSLLEHRRHSKYKLRTYKAKKRSSWNNNFSPIILTTSSWYRAPTQSICAQQNFPLITLNHTELHMNTMKQSAIEQKSTRNSIKIQKYFYFFNKIALLC